MTRIVTLAATAALLTAAVTPAAAQSIRVSTAGKSTAQINAEVAKAARVVCLKQGRHNITMVGGQAACEKATIAEAFKSRAYLQLATR